MAQHLQPKETGERHRLEPGVQHRLFDVDVNNLQHRHSRKQSSNEVDRQTNNAPARCIVTWLTHIQHTNERLRDRVN